MLDHGRWHGRTIVPEAWVAESLHPHISTGITGLSPSGNVVGYGYQWWTGTEEWNGRQIAWAAGVGNGGQRLYVVPELDVTVVMAAGEYGSPEISQTANRLLGGVIAAAR